MEVGVNYKRNGRSRFTVWAPLAENVELELLTPPKRTIPLQKNELGYWETTLADISPESLYQYRLNKEKLLPDPASQHQPLGVHQASKVVDHDFDWEDEKWQGIEPAKMAMYELHVGTFTPEGTFDAVIPRLDELKELGVNAVELMPVSQFPGERNWGYDGVYPFAVQNSYGGPFGLKKLVNECHKKRISVILDVVYNHLGPEGNYLSEFGHYFTDKYKTPWGKALNFDGPFSDEVRNFFKENALYWFHRFHIDALRLDAIHAINDMSAKPFLAELVEEVALYSKKAGRKFRLIAESNLNDSKIIKPKHLGGFNIDAQWLDDFHHCVHTLLTGEDDGYYADFGSISQLKKCLLEGFVYSGEYSKFRKRRHGNSSKGISASKFVVSTSNHDQVGNRMLGDRMSSLVSFEGAKLHAATTLLSPFIPLIFMGDEYAEDTPFLYFVSHTDKNLIEAVRKGRREEFVTFDWKDEPPDPQSTETFRNSILDWNKRKDGKHRTMLSFYKQLLKIRREIQSFSHIEKSSIEVTGYDKKNVITIRRWCKKSHSFLILNFNKLEKSIETDVPKGRWKCILDSSDFVWSGQGRKLKEIIKSGDGLTIRGHSAVLFVKES